MRKTMTRRLCGLALWVGMILPGVVAAHGFRVGDLVLDHPYATPSLPGSTSAMLHVRAIRNTGPQPDRLLGGSAPVATALEIHHMSLGSDGVMRMRAVDALPLPPGAEIPLRHEPGGEWHLMLQGLRQPLRVGERFQVTLKFERAGEKTVEVWVVRPRIDAEQGSHAAH